MGALSTFPTRFSAQSAWERYLALVDEAARNPLLWEDDAHTAARRAAHASFMAAFRMEGP